MAVSLRQQSGLALIELVVALMISAIIITGLSAIVDVALQSRQDTHRQSLLAEQVQFAMQRMVIAGKHSHALILPLQDNPATDWPENDRRQTVPASPPAGSSTFASAVFAIALPAYSDLDNDGVADADDDGDGLVDEDLPADHSNDGAPGIYLIDDDGDGSIDEGVNTDDDDEDGNTDEDSFDNIDNDNDGNNSEDTGADNNDDGCAGICGIDEDADDNIDEGNATDNDEDGSSGEDWQNAVVFYLNGNNLVERTPVPWDTAGGPQNGRDYIETVIADNVSRFNVTREITADDELALVSLALELRDTNGDSIRLDTQIRIGGAL